ncbi:deoxyguanosinetriphosphate triphosphohydrolase [Bartonella sp. HY329]|uniref:deoxyguanosinetriphosphate triphosphohydrolase n=1 Tax=unclassified Bartonella TaxID=2645622 RepID=UPI0021C6A8AF|nr:MULTISPECIES: deoxyguanosinetriphosphate triphosphohydrolase [unclassified Bartonella]UXM93933.1 deoxyguanosinetriphosphate triphosphohydrolase [Bartonella sp. HY329]UXN08254.1 deoxyguanosinetriphosphate triphosphohydrolase [Bartonella sp. HY328]
MELAKKEKINSIGYGYEPRAAFATLPALSRGRLIAESESATRTPFQRDRDRIIHSNAFRRLKHKTQVFVAAEDDHYRTRLTHSIEVSQIARALARALRLDEELAEAIALAHDFGHTPFGHAGEDALNEMMATYGGFDHNAQALHIVTALEHRYAGFNGLNLTWETLEGLVKHNGPLVGQYSKKEALSPIIKNFNKVFDLHLDQFAGPEAQCAAIADDIAYNAHDIDDGLRAGLITIEQLRDVQLTARLISQVETAIDKANDGYKISDFDKGDVAYQRVAYEIVRRQITIMVEDVIQESIRRLNDINPQSVDDIYRADQAVISFSNEMRNEEKYLKKFLFDNLYYHEKVLVQRRKGELMVKALFNAYMNDFTLLPIDWQNQISSQKDLRQTDLALAMVISDFLSGMTDQYAIREYERLFDQT